MCKITAHHHRNKCMDNILSVPMTVLVYYEVGTQWDNIRTSRKRKVRVIRYYMPENMPDSWVVNCLFCVCM